MTPLVLPRNTDKDALAALDRAHVPWVLQSCHCARLPEGSLLVEMVCVNGHNLQNR